MKFLYLTNSECQLARAGLSNLDQNWAISVPNGTNLDLFKISWQADVKKAQIISKWCQSDLLDTRYPKSKDARFGPKVGQIGPN